MILAIPWVKGSRTKGGSSMHSGYTVERIRWTLEQCWRAAPDLPVAVLTPHVECAGDFWPSKTVDCTGFLNRFGLVECGVMCAMFHPAMAHLDMIGMTADALLLKDPRPIFGGKQWSAPQQHLPEARPYGDWLMGIPSHHSIRSVAYKTFTAAPRKQSKFDRYLIEAAKSAGLEPRIVPPPFIINGEWVIRDWKPWAQPVSNETVAVHPDAGTKWPEFSKKHPYFHSLADRWRDQIPVSVIQKQQEACNRISIPTTLT